MDEFEVNAKQVRRSDLPYDGVSRICAFCERGAPSLQLIASCLLSLTANECLRDVVVFEERPLTQLRKVVDGGTGVGYWSRGIYASARTPAAGKCLQF